MTDPTLEPPSDPLAATPTEPPREPRVSTPVIAAMAFGFITVLLLSFAVEPHDQGFRGMALLAAPFFVGILAGLYRPQTAGWYSLKLLLFCILGAAPVLGEGIACLIVIGPIDVVITPLVALLVAAIKKRHGAHAHPVLLLPFMMLGADLLDRPRYASEILRDDVVVALPRAEVWRSLEHTRFSFADTTPLWMRVALPIPRSVLGGGAFAGAERRVLFDNGVVLARVTNAEPPTTFTMQLSVDESGREFFDHWVVLGELRFELVAIDDTHTRVEHVTHYVPRLGPRWYFALVERLLGHALQHQLLEVYGQALEEPPTLTAR